ncbi:2'-5' RNA ligase family protein [Aureimonas sp. AU20]|uniref:2'-5' RNA ligase family protein n=1 Tax=Aureimonas sp. AU20 TaxID=1349819 RepID=UPI00071F3629|nr:2'-5' RNA ligase family protein [Aureimonas sp. AU20]ALN73615.1 hypothetical protein M673_12880 [Aureimonas sp. AU20]
MTDAPLILTLDMDPASFQRFDTERRRFFPPERNVLAAHLTLFHALPGAEEPGIVRHLAALAARTDALPFTVPGLRSLGRGVAYEVDCDGLLMLRRGLAAEWKHWLTPQDAQGFRPHVTVQNKVLSDEARHLLEALRAGFQPFEGSGTGLRLWRYRGGPWEAAGTFPFAAQAA